jgi:hypothetical protein
MQIAVRVTLAATSPVPSYTGGPFASGVAQLSSSVVAGWNRTYLAGMAPVGERVDIVTGGNYVQLMDSSLSISNHDQWYAAFQTAGGALEGALVELGEATGPTTMTERWTGIVVDPAFQGMNIECRLENVLGARHKLIPARALSSQEFPGLPSDKEGDPVPVVYGAPERITSPSIQSERDYLAALRVQMGSNPVPMYRSTTMIAQPYGGAAPTTILVPVVYDILTGVTDYAPPDAYTDDPWWLASGSIYMDIFEGTGSGQQRKISGAPGIGYATIGADTFTWSNVALASPLDVLPDATSGIRFYAEAISAVLVVADEGTVSAVNVEQDERIYPIGFSQGAPAAGVISADVSAEFVNGEDFAALVYSRPSEVYGVTALSDGLTASGGTSRPFLPLSDPSVPSGAPRRLFDCLCRGTLYIQDVSDDVLAEVQTIYAMFAVDTSVPIAYEVLVLGERWTQTPGVGGSVDTLQGFATFPIQTDAVSTYSSSILPDGTPGNFASYALEVGALPVPLRAYRRIDFCLVPVDTATFPLRTIDEVASIPWTNGSNTITVGAIGATALGRKIRQTIPLGYSSYGIMDSLGMYAYRPSDREAYGGMPGNWKTVTLVTPLGGGNYQLTLDSPNAFPTNSYDLLIADASDFLDGTEMECGVAFKFGSIPTSSEFLVNMASGREFSAAWPALPSGASNGDPITLARDAVLDMYYRDLGLGSADVDFASFQALPSDPITSALVSRVDSAQRVADLCQQFNWVIAHASDGKEYATAWLARVGTATYDFSIDTGDVVEGSLTGVAISDIQDLVNLPNLFWGWTQKDGFASSCNVIDVKADPLTLNAGNYLQYLTGFGDFGTALDTYTRLHTAYQRTNYQRSNSFDLPDVGFEASLVLWPLVGAGRIDWMASRKPIYQMLIPDTSAAGAAIIGQRIRLRHKRYTSGAWVYGTLVEWSLDPMSAEYTTTIMGDPVTLDPAEGILYEDTIDPTASVPLWDDQTDGTSPLYEDQIGA